MLLTPVSRSSAFFISAIFFAALFYRAKLASCLAAIMAGFGCGATQIRQNCLLLHLILAQRAQIVRNRLIFVEADLSGVSANKTLIKDSAGKLIELLVFKRAQHPRADLSRIGDGVERDPAPLALLPKFFSKRSQRWLRERVNSRPHRDGNHHRRKVGVDATGVRELRLRGCLRDKQSTLQPPKHCDLTHYCERAFFGTGSSPRSTSRDADGSADCSISL